MDNPDIKPCPNCQSPLLDGDAMCPNCGWQPGQPVVWPPLVQTSPLPPSPQSARNTAGSPVVGFVSGFFLIAAVLYAALLGRPIESLAAIVTGLFVYGMAETPTFRRAFPFGVLAGVIALIVGLLWPFITGD
jgi:hypothetical protein